jgi:hypothetical protein
MAHIGAITVGSREVNLYAFTGQVVDQHRSTITEVVDNRNNSAMGSTTTTTSYNKLFIRAADGEERSLEIVDKGFSVRQGSTATLIWGIPAGKEKGDYLLVLNNDTGATHVIRKACNDLAGPKFYNMLLIVAAIFIAVGVFNLFSGAIFSAIIKLGIGVGGIYWIYKGQKALIAQVQAAAAKLRNT